MLSLNEKNLSTLYTQDRDSVINSAFDFLVSDDAEKKKYVRVNITSAEWFDGYGILTLAGKLFYDARAGWGRAKRNAVTAWYLKRPFGLVKRQIEETGRELDVQHEDIISFLHIPSLCVDEERYHYLAAIIGDEVKFEQFHNDLSNRPKKTGFWSFVSELLGG